MPTLTPFCLRFFSLFSLALIAFALILPAAAKPAAAPPAARREIQAIYNKIDAALSRKDVDTVADYDAEDCEYFNKRGRRLDAGSGRQALIDLLDNVDSVKRTTTITSFTATDADATVMVRDHVVSAAANRITGRAVRVVSEEVFRDYWVKTDDGWKRKRTREIKGTAALHKNFI